MFNTEIDWCRISGSALLPPPLGFSIYTTLRFGLRRSAAFFCRRHFRYVLSVLSVRHIAFCHVFQHFSSLLYQNKKINFLNSLNVRLPHCSHEFWPFCHCLPRYLCQCPPAKIPYSCILGYGRPVPSSFQLLHSLLLNQHYQSHLSRTSTWFYLTEINTSSVHDALTFYLLGNHWLFYLQLYVHNNPYILTAQPVASTPRLSALRSTSATVAASSSSTVTPSTPNVSAAS